jgi:hypothetical protein
MGPSLTNQTDGDFVHYTIVNDRASDDVSEIYRRHLEACGVRTTLVRRMEWWDLLKSESSGCGAVCVARIDDDDAIHADAVRQAKAHFRKGMLTVYGYTTGLRARIGDGFYRKELVSYGKSGHHSMFQTFMFDSSDNAVNPYDFDHSDVVGGLLKKGFSPGRAESCIVNGDGDAPWPASLYLRHKNSVSTANRAWYDDDSRFEKTSVDPGLVRERLGLSENTQRKILDGTLLG